MVRISRRRGCRDWLAAVTALGLVLGVGSCGEDRSVSPDSFDTFLSPGSTDQFTLNVSLTKLPPALEPLDIVFLLDATGSMMNVIGTMRQNAVSIIQEMRQVNPNTAFGVASFGDYGSTDPVWTLDQDITQDMTRVVNALTHIRMVDGGDLPEAYSRALYETLFLSWRPGARRYLILCGDAPAHDPDFYGRDFGVDPGRDGIPGTADDLRFRDVVRQLVDAKITVIGIYDRGPWYNRKELGTETKMGFEFVAKETGGLAVPVTAADQVEGAIRQGLSEVRPSVPVVSIPEAYATWLAVSASEAVDKSDLHYHFDVSISPPKGTPAGIYDMPLRVLAGDAAGAGEIGRSAVRVRIGWLNYAWRWPFIILLLLLLTMASWQGLRRRGGLMPTGGRMLGRRAEVGLLWRWALILGVIALIVVVAAILPDAPAQLFAL